MSARVEQRVLVVDDEPLARRAVLRQLAVVLPRAQTREARDGFEALAAVDDFAPSLVILDVEMPELSGIDVLRQLPRPRPKVVFVTAFEHFAVRAFEENACDYLVKPFSAERFAAAVARALDEIDCDQRLGALERSLSAAGHRLERLALRSGSRVDVVPVGDVVCWVSKEHYTYVFAGSREYISDLSVAHFEERLDPDRFVRVHRSVLVNRDRIRRIDESPPGAVELDNGMRVPLSRRAKTMLRARCRSGL